MASALIPVSPLSLPPRARSLLADNAGWTDGAPTRWEAPRSLSPVERDAARDAIGVLTASLRPATMDQIMQALMELRLHGRNAPPADGIRLVLDSFARLLREVPADILWQAKEAHLRASPFWPAPADLLALAEPLLRERRAMLQRAERLAAMGEPKPRHVPTEAERARFADGFKSLAAILRDMPGPEAQP